ncbi:MAG TPA: cation-transporting P-type ATPase [Arachnia sp.]|nr:cation-transporting P-type ATPase [Arachnia sp.]HMT86623.1 cation-transporting P-type ATPase [Arachnia sp.]
MTAPQTGINWYALPADEAAARLQADPATGLTGEDVTRRRATHGPNELTAEPQPSTWAVYLGQLKDPMNIMLLVVGVASFFIDQAPVGIMVSLLVVLNTVLGGKQELKARASVDALAKMQVPQAKVLRDGRSVQLAATELVPGDIVSVEAGDLIPADGRLLRTATLETQEAALTGESAPVSKDSAALGGDDVPLGDQANIVFQNTTVTRGTGTFVVTETGMSTQMGRIASMLSAVAPGRSPLQRELDQLTRVLGWIAWSAVAVIVVIGLLRGQEGSAVLLLGISMAVSAIPTGLPTFVQALLAHGAKMLADAKAIVKSLTDVETLGAISVINSDKTGTLTRNEMMVRQLYAAGEMYRVTGDGYAKTGQVLGVAGAPVPAFTNLALGLCLDSDATVSDEGAVVGDPTEAALVVLAAKLGIDAEETRRAYPRVAEVPFDSAYKYMATFHHLPVGDDHAFVELVKGGPDVILDRCTRTITSDGALAPIDDVRDDILAANRHLSERGLRVLAFAVRRLDGEEAAVGADPQSYVDDLAFAGMVGIIDPLRPEAVDAVATAHRAGIDVRMITGDHAVTGAAIGAELGLGPGAISGPELAKLSDDELSARLPELHVFGRVTPEDKLRLARLMQEGGAVVAMTGDAVNDAAALKQADIGVAMGSGSEVTKQAAKMILTDDNFGTLVTAIRLGRSIYDKIVSYVHYQMTQLLSLVLLFLIASVAGIAGGAPLTPMMVLFINFFISIFPVIVIMRDPAPDNLMDRPPRDPAVTISNPAAIRRWLLHGLVLFAATLLPFLLPVASGPDGQLRAATMAFVVMSLGTIASGLVMRRSTTSGLASPVLDAVGVLAIPVALTLFAVELPILQQLLGTVSLGQGQWLTAIGLALVLPVVVELGKLSKTTSARS